MPLKIIRQDLTLMHCDAVVNPTNESLVGTGGVDGQIHRAAGPALDQACAAIGHCAPGEAVLTPGYDLPARCIIHTVGPVWVDGTQDEANTLARCYRAALSITLEQGFESVAFPIISAGTYGFPKDQALQIALRELGRFLLEHDMMIYLVVFDSGVFQISRQLFQDITEYVDERYVESHQSHRRREWQGSVLLNADMARPSVPMPTSAASMSEAAPPCPKPASIDLRELERELDESFSQMLLRKIDERGMTDAECYKRANVDRKHFSKIRSDPYYRPSKPTALAFAIALELDLQETEELLRKAGYALSHSYRFDLIIEYFIVHRYYDILKINEALFAFDQALLGA